MTVNVEDLDRVRSTLKRAEEIIATLDVFREAASTLRSAKVSARTWNTNDDLMSESLLRKVIDAGISSMKRSMESELAAMQINVGHAQDAGQRIEPDECYLGPEVMVVDSPVDCREPMTIVSY